MRKGKMRICDICGKLIHPGGMGGHMRLGHGIKIKTIVNHVSHDVRDVPHEVREAPEELMRKQSQSEILIATHATLDKDSNGRVFWNTMPHYNDNDSWILFAKGWQPILSGANNPEKNFRQVVLEFERKFKCRYEIWRRENLHIQGRNMDEIRDIVNNYAHLNYSR